MKKIILIIILSIVYINLNAQWFSIGARLGYNTTLSTGIKTDNLEINNNLQNGFHTGLYMRIGRRFFAQPEVLYNYSTYKKYVNNANPSKIINQSIDVPVLLGISAVNNKNFKFRFMLGPKFSFDIGSTKSQYINNISETIRKSRLGLDCGIGFDFWRITLDLRYNLFPNVYKIKDVNETTINNQPLNSFQVTAGFRIFGENSNK